MFFTHDHLLKSRIYENKNSENKNHGTDSV